MITQEELKKVLDYNPDSGSFTWKINNGPAHKGKIAGNLCVDTGYWRIGVFRKNYLAHRLAFLWMEGYLPEHDIDHIDRHKKNNAWANLREASRSCNMLNCGVNARNRTGVKGVFRTKSRRWSASIRIKGVSTHLGTYDSKLEAAKKRYEMEKLTMCDAISSAKAYIDSMEEPVKETFKL